MAVESKIIVTAEDRTRAAFAGIERNADKTGDAFQRLTSTALKLAGAGTLINFFRTNAESTEKWRDEMARLDDVTKKFFNTVADSGDLDPLIQGIKIAYSSAVGLSIALVKIGQGVVALGKDIKLLVTDFRQSGREIDKWKQSVDEADMRFAEFNKNLFTDAPKGYANSIQDAAARTKEAALKMRQAEEQQRKTEEQRRKAVQDTAKKSEDAVNERLQKEQELLRRESEMRAEQREKDIQALLESQLTEKDLVDAKYASDLQTLYDARQQEYLTEAQFKTQREQLELEHRAKIGDIIARQELESVEITKESYLDQTMTVLDELAGMTAGVARYSKILFNINKAAAFANTALKVPEAVANSYTFGTRIGGPVLGAAFGAISLAAQLAQLKAISSTSFEGAGGSPGVPSLAGTPGTPVTDVSVDPRQGGAAQQDRVVNLYLSGEGSPTQSYVRDVLIPGLKEALADSTTFNVRTLSGL